MQQIKAVLSQYVSSLTSRPYLVIFLVCMLIYIRTIGFNFSYLDDNNLILDNYYFISRLSNILNAFRTDVFLSLPTDSYYRPIFTISLIIDAQIGGQSPWVYHLSNIIYHVIASFLVYKLLVVLGFKSKHSLVSALLFSAHPLTVQAVAWIPGRNDVLVTILFLSSFIFLINYLKVGKLSDLASHNLFFALALFTKEVALMLPFVVLVYLLTQRKKFLFNRLIVFCVIWTAIIFLWFILRLNAFDYPIGGRIEDFRNSLVNYPALFLYFGKVLFPINLSTYPILPDSNFYYGIASMVTIAGIYVLTRSIKKGALVLSFLFMTTILPGIYKAGYSVNPEFLEHRMYLPLVGFGILWTVFISRFQKAFLFSILVIPFLVLINLDYQSSFKNGITYWKNAVFYSPNSPLANRNLGAMYYLDNKYDRAEILFRKSLELNQHEHMASNNIGLIYLKRGEKQQALQYFQREIEINPYYLDVYNNLALLYVESGDYEKALENLEMVIKINPDNPRAYLYVAQIKAKNNDLGGALDYYLMAKTRGLIDQSFELLILQSTTGEEN